MNREKKKEAKHERKDKQTVITRKKKANKTTEGYRCKMRELLQCFRKKKLQLHLPLAHVCYDVLFLNEFCVLQELVLESELGLLALAPGSLVVKIDVRSLLIVFRDRLGLLVPLEPCQILFVESPRLLLQLTCRQILLVGSLLVVKDKEQGVDIKLLKHGRVVEQALGWRLRVIRRRRVRVLGRVVLGPLRVRLLGDELVTGFQHLVDKEPNVLGHGTLLGHFKTMRQIRQSCW